MSSLEYFVGEDRFVTFSGRELKLAIPKIFFDDCSGMLPAQVSIRTVLEVKKRGPTVLSIVSCGQCPTRFSEFAR